MIARTTVKRAIVPGSAGLAALVLVACACQPAGAQARGSEDLIGALRAYRTVEDDALPRIARTQGLGFVELVAANPGIDPWVPGRGTRLLLPTAHLLPDSPREGLVINLAELRLYYFPRPPGKVVTFPLGTGRAGWETPVGRTDIARKRVNPSWMPPDSLRAECPGLPKVVPPGPANPLGAHALDLGWPTITLHGTNKPLGIGRRVSHGCIRLYPEDIAWLFERVTPGISVTIVDQPVKVGWSKGELYLEVHPTQSQVDELEAEGQFTAEPIPDLDARLRHAAGDDSGRLAWPVVRRIARERRGIPLRVTY
jgi:L,D-transpeptidase ErfK/SrfK